MILKKALEYAALGWNVFPIHSIKADGECTCGQKGCKNAGKHPKTKNGFKDATTDEEKIRAWFEDGRANIGIATGKISGITIIDVDVDKGGLDTWRAIGVEPDTLYSKTGGGGFHAFFNYSSRIKTSSNTLGKGVDCRNDKGYIVAPPSIHPSGRRYEWMNEGHCLIDLPDCFQVKKVKKDKLKENKPAQFSLEQVEEMLSFVPSDDRDDWRNVGIILGREFGRSQEAWELYCRWADKCAKEKGRNHDAIMEEAFFKISTEDVDGGLTIGTIVRLAIDNGWRARYGIVDISNFVYYAPGNNYVYIPTNALWTASAVNAAVGFVNENGQQIKAADWLKLNRLCTSMTCDPAIKDIYKEGYDYWNGGLIAGDGAALYNAYKKSTIELGDSSKAEPFINHVFRVFNKEGDADQFLDYMAHRVQKPWEKPRFALLIAGNQGVGKDTAVEFCCPAIGEWNVANIDPSAFDSQFNEFACATLVRISEAANLHDMSKWSFNERTKVLIAGSPDICQINPKYGQKYFVRMHCGVIITTNHLTNGIYISQDDRRYDVIDAATMQEMGFRDDKDKRDYFTGLWEWFLGDGAKHVAALLNERVIDNFSPSGGQRKTTAQQMVISAGMSIDEWLDDALEEMGRPLFFRGDSITAIATNQGEKEMDVRRKLTNSAARLGYQVLKNSSEKDGRWKIAGKKRRIYIKEGYTMTEEDFKTLEFEEVF